MDKQSADRIIVKSNARMKIVLDWFSKNREWLKQQEKCTRYITMYLSLVQKEWTA